MLQQTVKETRIVYGGGKLFEEVSHFKLVKVGIGSPGIYSKGGEHRDFQELLY